MKKVMKRTLCVVLALAMFAFALFAFAACGKSNDGSPYLSLITGTKPKLANRISSEDLALINSAMADGAEEQTVKQAVIKLYDIANSGRIMDGDSLMLQETKMGIKIFGSVSSDTTLDQTNATVSMRGFTLKSGGDWYGEFVAQVDPGQALTSIVSMMSTMLKTNYHRESEPDAYYYNIIKDSAIDADCSLTRFPFSSYLLIKEAQKYDLDGFKEAANVLDAPNEIYNMDFVPDIVADGATIQHEDGVYKVHFSVDPNADPALLEQWYRLPQKDMKEGGQEIKSYVRYVCDLELWDNGYVKSYNADYVRDAGMASGVTIDKFNYLWNKDEILAVISDDYRLDDLDLADRLKFQTLNDYIDYYISADIVMGKLSPLYIALIVIACVVFVVIVTVIVIEILVRKGKLPKLAARREAKKQKRLAKKAAKKGEMPQTEQGADDASEAPEEAAETPEEAAETPVEEAKTPEEAATPDTETSAVDGSDD